MSGTKPRALTGPTAVVPVQARRLHSLLPIAHFQPEGIMILLRGFMTSTSGSATSTTGRNKFKGLSTNTLKIPRGNTRSCKQTIMSRWSCFKINTTKVRLSTGTMGITLHPVSKPAWAEGSPKVTCIHAFAYFPFHHLALHCI